MIAEKNYKSLNTEVVNSVISKMFAKVSLEQVVDKCINKINKNGGKWVEGSISVKVSENYKVKIKYDVHHEHLTFDLYIYEKNIDNKFFQSHHEWVNITAKTKLYEKLLSIISENIRRELCFYEDSIIRKSVCHNEYLKEWNNLTGFDYYKFNSVA